MKVSMSGPIAHGSHSRPDDPRLYTGVAGPRPRLAYSVQRTAYSVHSRALAGVNLSAFQTRPTPICVSQVRCAGTVRHHITYVSLWQCLWLVGSGVVKNNSGSRMGRVLELHASLAARRGVAWRATADVPERVEPTRT